MNKTVFSSISYTYDENGHIGYRTSMTDASGEAHWTYDLRGRMIEEAKTIVDRGTYITQWRYDNQNRITQMFYPNGDRVFYRYNMQGEIIQLGSNYQAILANRVFDQHGQVTEQYFGNHSLTCYEYSNWYDSAGRVSTIKTGFNDNNTFQASLQNLSYAYDSVGNITQVTDNDETFNFTYDALSRLISVRGAYSEDYSYDSNTGNLLSKSDIDGNYYYDPDNKPHAVRAYGSYTDIYKYDDNGQMIERHGKSITYDALGNLTDYNGHRHIYDGDGKRVMTEYSSGNPNGRVSIYIGNYYEKVFEPIDEFDPVDPPGSVSEMNYISSFPIVGNGESAPFDTIPGQSYYYVGANRVATRTEEGKYNWIYGDHLGSTSVTANRYGEGLSRRKYTAWGTTRNSSGEQATDYSYTGQMQVDDIYYYNARWYDPVLGRFMQADTLVPPHQGTQGFDRYAYVNNNPMRYTDPTGHCATNPYDQYEDYSCHKLANDLSNYFADESTSKSYKEYALLDETELRKIYMETSLPFEQVQKFTYRQLLLVQDGIITDLEALERIINFAEAEGGDRQNGAILMGAAFYR